MLSGMDIDVASNQQVSSSEAARVFTAGLAPIGTNPPATLLIP
jgi:hypothetical protein